MIRLSFRFITDDHHVDKISMCYIHIVGIQSYIRIALRANHFITILNFGSACGTVGRAVASDTRGLRLNPDIKKKRSEEPNKKLF